MSWQTDYEKAERVLMYDNSMKLPNGKTVLRFLTGFCFVKIGSVDYVETRYREIEGFDQQESGLVSSLPNKFVGLQVADMDNPGSYNPSGETPVFEMHEMV